MVDDFPKKKHWLLQIINYSDIPLSLPIWKNTMFCINYEISLANVVKMNYG